MVDLLIVIGYPWQQHSSTEGWRKPQFPLKILAKTTPLLPSYSPRSFKTIFQHDEIPKTVFIEKNSQQKYSLYITKSYAHPDVVTAVYNAARGSAFLCLCEGRGEKQPRRGVSPVIEEETGADPEQPEPNVEREAAHRGKSYPADHMCS